MRWGRGLDKKGRGGAFERGGGVDTIMHVMMEIFKMLYKIIAGHNKQQEPQDRAFRNPAINWLSV